MAKSLSKTGITTGNTVRAFHVTQSIDAFTGTEAYDIVLSGSLEVTGSITGQPGIINNLTSSYAITASHALNAGGTPGGSNTQVQFNDGGSFGGDAGFTFNKTTNSITAITNITASGNISSSGNMDCNNLTAIGITTINRVRSNNPTIPNTIDFEDSILVSGGHPITASGNIEATSYISASEFRTTGHITASGNISSSGNIDGVTIEASTRVVTPIIRSSQGGITIQPVNGNLTLTAATTASSDISSSGVVTA